MGEPLFFVRLAVCVWERRGWEVGFHNLHNLQQHLGAPLCVPDVFWLAPPRCGIGDHYDSMFSAGSNEGTFNIVSWCGEGKAQHQDRRLFSPGTGIGAKDKAFENEEGASLSFTVLLFRVLRATSTGVLLIVVLLLYYSTVVVLSQICHYYCI